LVLVAIGSLVGLWMFRRELRLSGLPDEGVDAAVAGIIGGLAGAKLLWVLEHLGEESVGDLLLSRGGMSWFGGFAGGVLAGLMVMHRKRLPKVQVLAELPFPRGCLQPRFLFIPPSSMRLRPWSRSSFC